VLSFQDFVLASFLIIKKYLLSTENIKLISQLLLLLFIIVLSEYLYNQKIGQSKNKKLFQVQIGAFIRRFFLR